MEPPQQPLIRSMQIINASLNDENDGIFEQKVDQLTEQLTSELPSVRTILSREQQLRIQIQDKQAYSGAKCFLYLFEGIALSLYAGHSIRHWTIQLGQFLFVICSFIASIYHYTRCHNINTHAPSSISTQNNTSQSFFCKYCKTSRGLRVKHCIKCDACIYKYDHHCFWIGNCVGEMNQYHFYCFLFSQTIFNCSIVSVLWYYSTQSWLYWIYLILTVMAVGFTGFTGFLLVYHTMLLATNQTTWEHIRRHKISYLKNLPKGCHPFSRGLLTNCIDFFRRKNSLTAWHIPEDIEKSHGFDLFDNEYYSCC